MNSQAQADLGNAMATAERIHDGDLSYQAQMLVYLMGAFISALDDLTDAIRER